MKIFNIVMTIVILCLIIYALYGGHSRDKRYSSTKDDASTYAALADGVIADGVVYVATDGKLYYRSNGAWVEL